MERCATCNVPGLPWCWLASIGHCDWLAAPHWAAHNAARSPLGPGRAESVTTPAVESVTSAGADLMARIESCPHRGETLREHQGCRCAQWKCLAGKGDDGVVKLRDCLACVSGET